MNVTLAFTTEFWAAQAKLPQSPQKKVRKFIEGYRANPKSSGFNFERIRGAASSNLRSVRIDQKYRAIVHQSRVGRALICLWVDNHDEAYDWACKYKCAVHPDTAAIQIYSVEHITNGERQQDESRGGLFDKWNDR